MMRFSEINKDVGQVLAAMVVLEPILSGARDVLLIIFGLIGALGLWAISILTAEKYA